MPNNEGLENVSPFPRIVILVYISILKFEFFNSRFFWGGGCEKFRLFNRPHLPWPWQPHRGKKKQRSQRASLRSNSWLPQSGRSGGVRLRGSNHSHSGLFFFCVFFGGGQLLFSFCFRVLSWGGGFFCSKFLWEIWAEVRQLYIFWIHPAGILEF